MNRFERISHQISKRLNLLFLAGFLFILVAGQYSLVHTISGNTEVPPAFSGHFEKNPTVVTSQQNTHHHTHSYSGHFSSDCQLDDCSPALALSSFPRLLAALSGPMADYVVVSNLSIFKTLPYRPPILS
jgi:hypothetical protein